MFQKKIPHFYKNFASTILESVSIRGNNLRRAQARFLPTGHVSNIIIINYKK